MFKTTSIDKIKSEDEKVLWALAKMRDNYFAHNIYFPFQSQKPSELRDVSILRKGLDLHADLVEQVLIKKISEILGFPNKKALLEDLKKQNFKDYTATPHRCKELADIITEVNNLYDFIEKELGLSRKDVHYALELVGPNDKKVRNELLHTKIYIHELEVMDPDVIKAERVLFKHLLKIWGRSRVLREIEERKQHAVGLKEETQRRKNLRRRLAEVTTAHEKRQIISRLKMVSPHRDEEAAQLLRFRHLAGKN